MHPNGARQRPVYFAIEMISILLVDDHPVVREGVAAILGDDPDLRVVGEASSGEDALKLIAAGEIADVVVVDVRLPGMSGIDIGLDVSGRSERVDRETERALYRVAHEALMNAWRHAACASITVELRFNSDALVLTVEDDGVGLLRRGPQRRLHLGISSMSRAMADVGGTLDLGCGGEGGVLVQATVARRP